MAIEGATEKLRAQFFLLFSLMAVSAAADAIQLREAIELFDRATHAIYNYDVRLKINRRWSARSVVVGSRKVGLDEVPIYEWQEIPDGQPPLTKTHFWHQVRDEQGRRRIEDLSAPAGEVLTTGVFDGEVTRTLSEKTRSGYLGPALPQFVQSDEDYIGFYAFELETPFLQMLHERDGVQLLSDPSRPGSIVFDIPPQEGKSLGTLGFKIYLDAEHGLLPRRIEVRRKEENGEVVNWRTTEVTKFAEVEPGVWAPVEVTNTSFSPGGRLKGQPTQVATASVDVARSRWNSKLPDDLFVLAFPQGVSVVDDLRRVTFVTGNPNREANLAELARQARKVVRNQPRLTEVRDDSFWLRFGLIGINIAVVITVAAMLLWRSFRKGHVA